MRRAGLLILLLLASGCGEDPPVEPVEGTVRVRLETPNATDGALLVRLVGHVTDVRPVGALQIASTTQGTLTRVLITGTITTGDILELTIPDAAQAANIAAAVEQAASRIDYALFDPLPYRLVLRPQ